MVTHFVLGRAFRMKCNEVGWRSVVKLMYRKCFLCVKSLLSRVSHLNLLASGREIAPILCYAPVEVRKCQVKVARSPMANRDWQQRWGDKII